MQEYTLLEFLGEGSTAQVYLAKHEESESHVAIKVIDKLLIRRAQLESKVHQEMVLHTELRHPHVLRVERVFDDARNYYMVLEYCAQRSLAAFVKTLPSRQMNEKTTKKLFRQIVAGVVYLHASNVIHRDLKLANLLLNAQGEIKISDFGLATRLGAEAHVTMCGTPNFIAPEVLLAEYHPYTEAVDMWSLGCILYCLLLGKPPFEGRKVSETLENVANAGQTPLIFPHGFSFSASDLIQRLLTSDPSSRPSAQQILLHPWLRDQSQKRLIPLSNSRQPNALLNVPQPVPLHPRARALIKSRESRSRSMQEEESMLPSFNSSIPAIGKQRFTQKKSSGQRLRRDAAVRTNTHQSTSSDSSRDSSAEDHLSSNGNSDSSDCTLSTPMDEFNQENDALNIVEMATRMKAVVSVVIHFEVQNLTWFEPFQKAGSNSKLSLQWSCKEPDEIGQSPKYKLKISNGWEVDYNPIHGVVTAKSVEGEFLRYEIPGMTGMQSFTQAATVERPSMPLLIRFCHCLQLRTMQLRRFALRGQASKLPLIQYDTLPESLLASFHERLNLFKTSYHAGFKNTEGESNMSAIKQIELPGIGCGSIDSTGDLRVVFLDGAQLTLTASGHELKFRPAWVTKKDGEDEKAHEDVFELLSNSSFKASYLPSVVKQKFECIPEFIRRLKASI
ncbi:hypothetical protein CCR75_005548 [Bremia lactucae]|uniref:Protein kinase domain-containing protein n=1 Tax=Bremia lactucae TaxID=4779 RepID=A0A976IFP0_BRELC|nr:hypothetical protein CCR75_005548 [Bremia lactucae]